MPRWASRITLVSIRARHCWRASRWRGRWWRRTTSFQSAPAIAGGRASHRAIRSVARTTFQSAPAIAGGRALIPSLCSIFFLSVSIRARHCWRASRCRACHHFPAVEFQSAPAIAGGRASYFVAVALFNNTFQSAPAIAGGRASKPRIGSGRMNMVSIRARHCWRASPHIRQGFGPQVPVSIRARHCWRASRVSWRSASSTAGFNPRPPLLAGEPGVASRRCEAHVVSIRARHCWRASPCEASYERARDALFQSAPAIAGGRAQRRRTECGTEHGFNPRPPLLAGEPAGWLVIVLAMGCFNPRPPLLAGEPNAQVAGLFCPTCFNPRPPLLAGEP